jgi:hypothetical protein
MERMHPALFNRPPVGEPAGIEEAFEQQDGREFIDRFLSLIQCGASLSQNPLSFDGRQPLIPIDNGKGGLLPQAFSELFRVRALPAVVTAHVKWLSDQDQGNAAILSEFCQVPEVVPDPDPLKRGQALGRDSKPIRDRKTNALLADVHGENTPAQRFRKEIWQSRL